MNSEFNTILLRVSSRIARTLEFIPDDIKNKCEEIRLRVGLPLCLTVDGNVMFVCCNSGVSTVHSNNTLTVLQKDIDTTLSMLCNNSVYLHENEIKQGFVSVIGGYRAGVCGNFNAEGMLVSVSSVNIRISRQIFDCSNMLLPYAADGLLIAGPPASGKTTMLRDIIRQISNGIHGKYYRVCVIDSRREISGGIGTFDLGVNTDVLYTENKAIGTQIALRTMFPNIIAFDEIGTRQEFESIKDCFNAGVGIITTAHVKTIEDLTKREITKSILKSGAITNVALLNNIGDKPQIINVKRLKEYVCS